MHIQKFIEATGHRITGGSQYQWQCYGDHARWLDAGWEDHNDRWQASAVFDSRDQRVYECQVSDYHTNQAWSWRDPEFESAHRAEAQQRNVDADQAWDEVRWQPSLSATEILNRIRVKADPRETVELDLDNDKMLEVCMRAHELDMTLNDYIEMVLRAYIDREHPGVLDGTKAPATMEPKKSAKRKKK